MSLQRRPQNITNALFIMNAAATSCFMRHGHDVFAEGVAAPHETLTMDPHRGLASYRLVYPVQVNDEEFLAEAFVEITCVGDDVRDWHLKRHTFKVGTFVAEDTHYDKRGREKTSKVIKA